MEPSKRLEPCDGKLSSTVLRGGGGREAVPLTRLILDVFRRYVVGWMVAQRESAVLARRLIEETCQREGVARDQLTLHADRGSSMRSKAVALLLSDLGVTKTHSRPYTSTDNPFSEAQFKTLKYRPQFPSRFGSLQHARSFCRPYFGWYNAEHRHSGLAMLTPHDVHFGLVEQRLAERTAVLATAFAAHPERFPNGVPAPDIPPQAVWINKPVECGCKKENELVEFPESDDPETTKGRDTPESAAIGTKENEMSLVNAL